MEEKITEVLVERPTLSGAELREAFTASGAWLDRHAEAINALNVFPVPDGDTGLNMSLTLGSALEQLRSTGASSVGEVAEAVARGALLGARGNSGVILAQLLRGMARTLHGHEAADGKLLAAALVAGADAAYTAVTNPVEGTILTVARGAGRAAQKAAASLGPLSVLEHAHRAARAAVAETPDQLPILKQAGVVDSGGEGYRVVLEGLLRSLRGEPMEESPIAVTMRVDFSALHQDADDFYGYCTEVLFQGANLDANAVRTHLQELGSSVLVVGDEEMLKVHVHTLHPGAVLELATDLGEIVKVKIDNMQIQHQEFAAAPTQPASGKLGEGTSIVAVALGAGFEEIFASLGAVAVRGGQTMNPSVGEITAAIQKASREEVIILPNDRNVRMAAEHAAQGFQGRKVQVLPTESIPQGIAAALALNPEADADANVSTLAEAASRCRTIELTRAVRSARLNGLAIDAGAPLAILDGDPVATGASFEDALRGALHRLPRRDYEIVTIYVGSEATAEDASSLAEIIRQQTGLPVDIAAGGQPHYLYIISVE